MKGILTLRGSNQTTVKERSGFCGVCADEPGPGLCGLKAWKKYGFPTDFEKQLWFYYFCFLLRAASDGKESSRCEVKEVGVNRLVLIVMLVGRTAIKSLIVRPIST